MAVDHVKSTYITNADAGPAVANTAGEGAAAALHSISSGAVVGVASSSINATYQFVRVPSNCKIKQVLFDTETQAAGAMDIGVYYATDGEGGQPKALLAAAAISQALFGSAITITAVGVTDVTNESGSYTPALRNQPLWQAAGLATDPGGYFDIVGTLTTAITTGTGKMGLTVNYTT
jgi:hypothetical protein